MHLDVVELERFYATRLGRMVGNLVTRKLRGIWPDVRGRRVLGLGYATPFLTPFRAEAERVVAFMPAPQGAAHWPRGRGNLAALTEETQFPVPDAFFDCVILVHGLESTEATASLMREIWRIMTQEGRLIVIVPNRTGLWARFERTPFGWGRPYSQGQLKRFLAETMFSPVSATTSLYAPPFPSRLGVRSLAAMERFGDGWLQRFAGILMVEAEKRTTAQPLFKAAVRAPGTVPAGVIEGLKGRRWF